MLANFTTVQGSRLGWSSAEAAAHIATIWSPAEHPQWEKLLYEYPNIEA